MFAWALLASVPPLGLAALLACRRGSVDRIVAVQLASAIATQALVLASFVYDEPSYVDLALTLAFLSVPGTLLFALFYERWL